MCLDEVLACVAAGWGRRETHSGKVQIGLVASVHRLDLTVSRVGIAGAGDGVPGVVGLLWVLGGGGGFRVLEGGGGGGGPRVGGLEVARRLLGGHVARVVVLKMEPVAEVRMSASCVDSG